MRFDTIQLLNFVFRHTEPFLCKFEMTVGKKSIWWQQSFSGYPRQFERMSHGHRRLFRDHQQLLRPLLASTHELEQTGIHVAPPESRLAIDAKPWWPESAASEAVAKSGGNTAQQCSSCFKSRLTTTPDMVIHQKLCG